MNLLIADYISVFKNNLMLNVIHVIIYDIRRGFKISNTKMVKLQVHIRDKRKYQYVAFSIACNYHTMTRADENDSLCPERETEITAKNVLMLFVVLDG